MFIISKEKLFEYLNNGANFIALIGDKEIEIERDISFVVSEKDFSDVTQKVAFRIGEKSYKTKEKFLSALKKLSGEDNIKIKKIDNFGTIEEYEENEKFQNADMEYLLNKYADCDVFSLSTVYGENKISEEDAASALSELKQINKDYTLKVYNKLIADNQLPPYKKLYEDIKKECEDFGKNNKKKYMQEYGFFCNSFICDHVGEDTKYSEPKELFWHFYHSLGGEIDSLEELLKLQKIKKEFNPTDLLNTKEFNVLKENLLSYKITFQTHCTGGPLQTEYKFKINGQTKKWLLCHKDDYDFEDGLEDLAFYKGDKIRFSSCTHEGFHDDIK